MDRIMILLVSIFGLWMFISFKNKATKSKDEKDTKTTTVKGSEAEINSILNSLGISSTVVSVA